MTKPASTHFNSVRGLVTRALLTSAFLLCVTCHVSAQTGSSADLSIWLPLFNTDPITIGGLDIDRSTEEFVRDFPAFFKRVYGGDVSSSVKADIRMAQAMKGKHDYALRVMGQRVVFESLSRFARDTAFEGTITVRFFEWADLLGSLRDIQTMPNRDRPSVVIAPSTWISHLAEIDVLQPIDVGKGDRDSYVPKALAMCEAHDRKYYALPWLSDPLLMFYQRKFFRPDDFRDLTTLKGALETQTRNNPDARLGFPTTFDWDLFHVFSILYWGHGGEYLENNKFLTVDTAAEVLKFVSDLRRESLAKFSKSPSNLERISRADLQTDFVNGRVGIIVSGPWLIPLLEKQIAEGTVSFVLPPSDIGRPKVTYTGGLNLGLTRREGDNADALKLIRFLGVDSAKDFTRIMLPAAKSGIDQFIEHHGLDKSDGAVVREAMEVARSFPAHPKWAVRVEESLTRNRLVHVFDRIWSDNQPDEAKRSLQLIVDELTPEFYPKPPGRSWIYILLAVLAAATLAILSRRRGRARGGIPSLATEASVSSTTESESRAEGAPSKESSDTNSGANSDGGVATSAVNSETGIVAGCPPLPRLLEQLKLALYPAPKVEWDDLEDSAASLSPEIVGRSDAIKRVKVEIQQVAETDGAVLIIGEPGVGKELVANAIHRLSSRGRGPFVAINCGKLPVESELLGYERYFEDAKKGTIFLDDFGEAPPELQVNLLKAIGKNGDSRVIMATSRDLSYMLTFYRIETSNIPIPPLRDRPEDIPLLVRHFCRFQIKEQDLRIPYEKICFSDDAKRELLDYAYPGNVAELSEIVARALSVCPSGSEVDAEHLPIAEKAPRQLSLSDLDRSKLKEALAPFKKVAEFVLQTLCGSQDSGGSRRNALDQVSAEALDRASAELRNSVKNEKDNLNLRFVGYLMLRIALKEEGLNSAVEGAKRIWRPLFDVRRRQLKDDAEKNARELRIKRSTDLVCRLEELADVILT